MTRHPPAPLSHQRRWVLLTLSSAGSLLFSLQPWASCPDSESTAGCPVTGVQVYAQAVVLFLVPASLTFVVTAGIRAVRG